MINPASISCSFNALILLLAHRMLFLNCVSTLSNNGPTNCYVVAPDKNPRQFNNATMHLWLSYSTCECDPIVLYEKTKISNACFMGKKCLHAFPEAYLLTKSQHE